MFIDATKYKAILKKAYKGAGVTAYQTEGGVYKIITSGTYLQVIDTYLTKKVKAAIIEVIGELPEKGACKKYTDYEVPEEQEPYTLNLQEQAYNSTKQLNAGRVYIDTGNGRLSRIYQTEQKLPELIPVRTEVVVRGPESNTEDYPIGPVKTDYYAVWYNSEMAFGIILEPICCDEEREFIQLITGKNLTWENG